MWLCLILATKLASGSIGETQVTQKNTTSPTDSPTLDEQYEIVGILNAIDRKIDLHRRKRAVLEHLFKALLHKLMTREIFVTDLDVSGLSHDTKMQGNI